MINIIQFSIERCENNDAEPFELRPFANNAQKSFYIGENVLRAIQTSGLVQLVSELSLQAAGEITIVYSLEKMEELRQQYPSGKCELILEIN